jgi:DNA-binding NtrC family response regulator
LKVPQRRITDAALQQLMTYDFPGNIRELRNLIERACILANGDEILPEAFPANSQAGATNGGAVAYGAAESDEEWIASLPETVDLRGILNSLERRLIQRALSGTGGAQAEAARRLGLSRSDLSYKVGKYDLKGAVE